LINSVPFRRCDSSNFGVSRFCSLSNKYQLRPNKFAAQIEKEYTANFEYPDFISSLESSQRKYSKTIVKGDIFTQNEKEYDAYDKDIALVHIFFRKSTIFQMGSTQRMGWVDYFSNVGGLLGLVLGMGIVSVIELVWLSLRLAARQMGFSHWIV
jgi:hypothetical protein